MTSNVDFVMSRTRLSLVSTMPNVHSNLLLWRGGMIDSNGDTPYSKLRSPASEAETPRTELEQST
jgi:hypothetical protein